MRYHYEEPNIKIQIYGEIYVCNHPVYNRCTLFKISDRGISVIQQRFNCVSKRTWWDSIDVWIANDIYLNPGFRDFFEEYADEPEDGLYPTITVRQIMWSLKMKPLKKERWETAFDHKNI